MENNKETLDSVAISNDDPKQIVLQNVSRECNSSENNEEKAQHITIDETQHISEEEMIIDILESRKEGQKLATENILLQKKLSAFINSSAGKEYFKDVELPKNANQDMFFNLLKKIEEKLDEVEMFNKKNMEKVEALKSEISRKKEEYKELNESFMLFKENVALQSVNSDTGEKLTTKEVKDLLRKEQEAEEIVQHSQLKAIKQKHKLQETLQKKNNLAEGPVDYGEYEIMCSEIENNIEISKEIEEETQEIVKKTVNMVNILSHLMQKLYSLRDEKELEENEEKGLEEELAEMRNYLFEEKMEFNKINDKNEELQHKCILLRHPKLLEDYKILVAENEEAKLEVERLKDEYASCMKIVFASK